MHVSYFSDLFSGLHRLGFVVIVALENLLDIHKILQSRRRPSGYDHCRRFHHVGGFSFENGFLELFLRMVVQERPKLLPLVGNGWIF